MGGDFNSLQLKTVMVPNIVNVIKPTDLHTLRSGFMVYGLYLNTNKFKKSNPFIIHFAIDYIHVMSLNKVGKHIYIYI